MFPRRNLLGAWMLNGRYEVDDDKVMLAKEENSFILAILRSLK